jgi:hypothetical protein
MTIRRITTPRLIGVGAFVLCSAVAQAQELRGVVRDASLRQPVSNAVLLLLDSLGQTRGRNITDDSGRYRIALSPGMVRLRVVRLGFRPSEAPIPLGRPSQVEQLDVDMTALPTMLEPVRVSSGARCSARKDRIAALSLLEQARAGLLAAVVAQEQRPAQMIRMRSATRFDEGDAVSELRVRIDSSDHARRAFQAVRSAADFVKLGFLDTTKTDETLYAPDAETLLDDDFRNGYCFQLRDRDAKRPHEVGLGFTSANRKRGRVDVDGTLWIDTLARALDEIRYSYVGLDRAAARAEPGGHVRFRVAPNGIALIDDWAVRVPSFVLDTVKDDRDNRSYTRIKQVNAQESGGALAAARWSDGVVWTAPLGTARVTMTNEAGVPLRGRMLQLDGTDYRGKSDSNGVVTISRLLRGPYAGVVIDSTLNAVGVALKAPLKFAIRDSETVTTRVVVPTAAAYVSDACRTTSTAPQDPLGHWFMARIVDSSGVPVSHGDWHAWRRIRSDDGGPERNPANWADIANASGTTSSNGLLQYCGAALEEGDRVRIEVRASKQEDWQYTIFTVTGPITAHQLRLMPITKPPLRDGME